MNRTLKNCEFFINNFSVYLVHHLKKRRNERANAFLRHHKLYQFEKHREKIFPQSKSLINHVLIKTDIRIASGQQIELVWRISLNIPTFFFILKYINNCSNKIQLSSLIWMRLCSIQGKC